MDPNEKKNKKKSQISHFNQNELVKFHSDCKMWLKAFLIGSVEHVKTRTFYTQAMT